MNVKAKQVMHRGLRGFGHLIDEIRSHLPEQGKDEGSDPLRPPPISEVPGGEKLRTGHYRRVSEH